MAGAPEGFLAEARRRAEPRCSGFRVGAVARDADGGCHLGFNLEFGGFGLTVHAEQCAAVAALEGGSLPIYGLWVDAAPCGHCRQFLLEFGDPVLRFGGRRRRLGELLPDPFGPAALTGKASPLASHRRVELPSSMDPEALSGWAAATSHHAYSGVPSGLAAELQDGTLVTAGVVESVAFNPSITPLASLLIQLRAASLHVQTVRTVFLCEGEGPIHDPTATRRILRALAPGCAWQHVAWP